MAELCDALLSAVPCERPAKKPLESRRPEGIARELPNGRGFLRVVPSSGAPARAPSSPSPEALPPAPAAPATLEPVAGQLDLFAWKPRAKLLPPPGTQLDLFDPR